ncbi:hypothetical protein ACR0ST_03540 [Aliidiomarina sp. Khilg15.8]
MYTLRYLILILLFSAVATSATAVSTQAMDGYQASDHTIYFAVSSPEYEGDEPDGLCSSPNLVTWLQPASRIGFPQAYATAFYYGDYQPRAPPQLL